MSTTLYLIGGSQGEILSIVAQDFVPASGGSEAAIALLLIGGAGWQDHAATYAEPWRKFGAGAVHVITPDDDGVLDEDRALCLLRESSGVFIGGGPTPRYHALYATDPLRSALRELFERGVPIAGLSAGALLAPDACLSRPAPKDPDRVLQVVPGLGLVHDLIVEVHFDESPSLLASLLEGMARTRTRRGLGVCSSACAVIEDGLLTRTFGGAVYGVTMADFETRAYTMRPIEDR